MTEKKKDFNVVKAKDKIWRAGNSTTEAGKRNNYNILKWMAYNAKKDTLLQSFLYCEYNTNNYIT